MLVTPDKIPVNTIYVIHSKRKEIPLQYLLAILNSRLIAYYTSKKYATTAMRGGFIELRAFEIESMPIRIGDKKIKPAAELVEQITKLSEKLVAANEQTDESVRLKREIAAVDARIDELVFDLYGLTAEERRIVEESFAK
ncbi:MAG: TaqI-like C-terminal specificity domain-containing protein [Candidatus Micrarchaeota archaeon]